MRDYEEKSYYEIQLDNKQLILVFLAGVTVCVLIFVLGVLVGKGKKEAEMAAVTKNETPPAAAKTQMDAPDVTPPAEAKPVLENKKGSQKSATAEPTEKKDEDYSFYDLDKSESEPKLTKKEDAPAPPAAKKTSQDEAKSQEKVKPEEKAKPEQKAKPDPAETKVPAVAQQTEEPVASGSPRYTVQVMATASKSKAEQQLSSLKSKGYAAYMDEDKGVFKVRVGKYADSNSAKQDATKIKEDMNLDTWVAVLD
jgi:cell division septation protein DedD